MRHGNRTSLPMSFHGSYHDKNLAMVKNANYNTRVCHLPKSIVRLANSKDY
jgi:hypothetical protein